MVREGFIEEGCQDWTKKADVTLLGTNHEERQSSTGNNLYKVGAWTPLVCLESYHSFTVLYQKIRNKDVGKK